jgi:16S rRNA C1402 (ribose-2'-O) methylase RsmI
LLGHGEVVGLGATDHILVPSAEAADADPFTVNAIAGRSALITAVIMATLYAKLM